MEETKERFVFNDTEVKLTGRTAEREVRATRRTPNPEPVLLHEVTPNNPEDGSWKKWVRLTDLYKIKSK